jgi:WD40 repeat protein
MLFIVERRNRKWIIGAAFVALDIALGIALKPKAYVQPLTPHASPGHLAPFAEASYESKVLDCSFAENDTIVAVLSDGSLEARRLSTRERLWRIEDYDEEAHANELTVIDQGRRVVAWNTEGFVWVFDAKTGRKTTAFDTSEPTAWSGAGRFFIAQGQDGPVVADCFTGEATPTTLVNACRSTVADSGESYAVDGLTLRRHGKGPTIEWRSLLPSNELSWRSEARSVTGGSAPRITVSVRNDFSKLSDLLVSPDGKTLVLGRICTTLEFLDLATLKDRAERGEARGSAPVRSRIVSLPGPLLWSAWVHKDLFLAVCGENGHEDVLLLNARGELLTSQRETASALNALTDDGVMALRERNHSFVARRVLGVRASESWTLDGPPLDKGARVNLNRNYDAAVATGATIRFYRLAPLSKS